MSLIPVLWMCRNYKPYYLIRCSRLTCALLISWKLVNFGYNNVAVIFLVIILSFPFHFDVIIYLLKFVHWIPCHGLVTVMNSELVGSSVFVLVSKTQLLAKWICSSWKQLSLLLLVSGEQVLISHREQENPTRLL